MASTCSTSLTCRCRTPARRARHGRPCGCRRRRAWCRASVKPCSGPTTWTMPCSASSRVEIGHAEFGRVALQRGELLGAFGSAIGRRMAAGVDARRGRQIMIRHRKRKIGPAHLAAGQRASPQRPAGWSLRGRGGDRYRSGRCRRRAVRRHGRPRSSRTSVRGTAELIRTVPRFMAISSRWASR